MNKTSKTIRFIDSHYNELFRILDGEKIIITAGSDKIIFTCKYLDDYHTDIGYNCYHICQFAEIMEKNHYTYAPYKECE